jgi:lysophospholipid acyltransferase (LPLAT)-like uncharacterized protein
MGRPSRPGGFDVARGVRWLIGLLLGVVARAWLATLRVEVIMDPALETVRERPWVLAFFHGTQWPLLSWRRRRRTLVMVSWSLDGATQARALTTLGLSVVRGSSSRGGIRGLAQLTRHMKRERCDAAFAVDGPRGPYGVVKGGAMLAARAAHGVAVPMGSAFSHGVVLDRAWDRFGIAWPLSRVLVVLGAPVEATGAGERDARELGTAIVAANTLASRILVGGSRGARGVRALVETGDGAGVAGPSK